MEILYYNDLDFSKVKKQFEKTVNQLKAGNWAGAEIKKMQNTGYYRARLDAENRLLFKFAKHKELATAQLIQRFEAGDDGTIGLFVLVADVGGRATQVYINSAFIK